MTTHILRVRKTNGRGSGLAMALPVDWVRKQGLKFNDLIVTTEKDGRLELLSCQDKQLLQFAKDLGALKEVGRPMKRPIPHPARTIADEAR